MPKNLLTRLMRGAASFQFAGKPISFISTHAPHARRDKSETFSWTLAFFISTHAPHARRDYTPGMLR